MRFYECPLEGACLGGRSAEVSVCNADAAFNNGTLCAQCAPGFTRNGDKCALCPPSWLSFLLSLAFLSLFMAFVLYKQETAAKLEAALLSHPPVSSTTASDVEAPSALKKPSEAPPGEAALLHKLELRRSVVQRVTITYMVTLGGWGTCGRGDRRCCVTSRAGARA